MNLIKIFATILLCCQITMAINRSGYFFERLQKYSWWQRVWKKYEEQQRTTIPQPTTNITPTMDTTIPTVTVVSPTISSVNPTSNQTPITPVTTDDNNNNENRENDAIITQYKIVQNITLPKLFGFSREEAERFPSRISEIVLPFRRECNHTNLPKYTKVKIMELKSIFNSHQCTAQSNQMEGDRTTTQVSSLSSLTTNGENWQNDMIRNEDGSVTRVRRCLEKGTLTKNNNLRLCAECQAVTELPENM